MRLPLATACASKDIRVLAVQDEPGYAGGRPGGQHSVFPGLSLSMAAAQVNNMPGNSVEGSAQLLEETQMTNLCRRGILILAAVAAISLSGCASMRGFGPDKAVYHINDSANAAAVMRNVGNHLSVDPTARIVIVSHARGVDFLMENAKDKNGNPYNIKVEELAAKGVTFDVCEITLSSRKLNKNQFIPEAKFVPSGVGELAKLQSREGYVYIKP
ncbi:MAG: DsrE family protein [Pseudomonadota bacterium]